MTATRKGAARERVRARGAAGRTPWYPERLVAAIGGAEAVEALHYVVVEEAVDDVLVLQAWPWPHVDASGRLFWDPDTAPLEFAVYRAVLHEQLYAHQLRRAPRVGDAFAGTFAAAATSYPAVVEDLRDLFPDGLFDVSAEAHQVAKLAYQGSLAAVPTPRAGPEAKVRLSGTVRHLRLQAPAAGPAPS